MREPVWRVSPTVGANQWHTREITFSNTSSRVSAKVAVGQKNVVDDGRLNLGRRPEKRQREKACGLDRRMSGMMKRANTSFAADFTATKRSRNASGSSSSIISSEAPPRTPADAIHERTRGNALGDGFSIIKLGDRGLIGFGDDLPSWNDRRKEMQVRHSFLSLFNSRFLSLLIVIRKIRLFRGRSFLAGYLRHSCH